MARHSSRNTAAATFTYHERSLLKYGTKRQRVGKESFRNPDDCNLCLERARQPICCPNGHLFCKECIMANLLAQKQDILRMKKQHNAREQKELRVKEGQNLNIQEESVAQFEKMQSGQHDTMKSKELFKKRKLENGVGNDKADVQIANSYWIPAYTPETNNAAPEVTKLNPICPASDEDAIHILKLKALIDVSFFDDIDGDSSGGRKACPCCSRSITVGVKIYRKLLFWILAHGSVKTMWPCNV